MIAQKIYQPLLFTIVLLLSGCGYHNPYMDQGNRPISLYHSMWPNRTTEIGLENVLFQSQSDWMRKSPLITLTDSADNSDYELTGAIDQVSYPEVSFGTHREGIQGNARLKVSFALKDRKSGKIVWKRTSTREQTFPMVQNPTQLKVNRNAALQVIADKYGEEIYLYLINTIMRPGTNPIEPIIDAPVENFTLEKLP